MELIIIWHEQLINSITGLSAATPFQGAPARSICSSGRVRKQQHIQTHTARPCVHLIDQKSLLAPSGSGRYIRPGSGQVEFSSPLVRASLASSRLTLLSAVTGRATRSVDGSCTRQTCSDLAWRGLVTFVHGVGRPVGRPAPKDTISLCTSADDLTS
jgi:hypothetical protein